WAESWYRDVATQTSRFALAHRLRPTLKPRKHFINTPREVYGRPVQCRTGHGFIGEYYVSFVPTEPSSCLCRENHVKRENTLCECPLFTHQRTHLRDVSRNIILNEILLTEKGIEALAKFIQESDVFKKVAILEQNGDFEGRVERREEQERVEEEADR
ncbi:hypothetical protein EDB19DRAFT_1640923, partial [Suillus lakei]